MTAAVAAAVLGASLLGSLHCAGMCGGLVALYAAAEGPLHAARRGHAAYNLGRLAAYALLGGAAGFAGALVDLGGRLAGIQSAAAMAAGLALALFGLHALAVALGFEIPRLEPPQPLRTIAARAAARLRRRSLTERAVLLGLLSALLPCGWLWAFLATAAGTGSVWGGAALMAVFWAGTVPALLSVGAAARLAAGPLRRHLPAACAAVVVAMGIFLAFARGGPADPAAAPAGVPGTPPCHVSH